MLRTYAIGWSGRWRKTAPGAAWYVRVWRPEVRARRFIPRPPPRPL